MKGAFAGSIRSVPLIVVLSVAVGSPAFAEIFLAMREGHVSIGTKDRAIGQARRGPAEIGTTRTMVDPREFTVPTQPECAAAPRVATGAMRPGGVDDARRTAVLPPGTAWRRSNQK